MKLVKREKLILDFTLDSSEAIMFNKGGKHTYKYSFDEFTMKDWEKIPDFSEYNEIELTFQMDSSCESRHNWIQDSSKKVQDSRGIDAEG